MYWADPMDFISEEETLALFKTNINEKTKKKKNKTKNKIYLTKAKFNEKRNLIVRNYITFLTTRR